MPKPCSICSHPRRRELQKLRHEGAGYDALAAGFGVSIAALSRHFNSPKCRARCEAVEEPGEAAQAVPGMAGRVEAPAQLAAVPLVQVRQRAIRSPFSRPVQSIAPPADPPQGYTVPAPRSRAVPSEHSAASPLSASPQELALLQSVGYNPQQIGDLVGWGADKVAAFLESTQGAGRSLFETSRKEWARHFVRLAMEELISLRRRRQAALDGLRWREAERYDPKIAAATRELFLTLERFGLVGPLEPDERFREGDDMRETLGSLIACMKGELPPELREEKRHALM